MERRKRTRDEEPRMLPWDVDTENDVVGVDTTWGEVQPLEAAPGVRTVGELELIDLMSHGAMLIDCRSAGTTGGRTIGGSVNIPYDEVAQRLDQFDPGRQSVLFCNGPQCPQSPTALRALIDEGYPAEALAYYRGGMHDWITLSMPTEAAVP